MSDREASFIALAAAHRVELSAIDDYIEAWHDSASDESLPAYLGMSEAAYLQWLENPDVLTSIVERARQAAAVRA